MKLRIFTLTILLLSLLLVGCGGEIVGESQITGAIVSTGKTTGLADYGETVIERRGEHLVPIQEYHIEAKHTAFHPSVLHAEKGDIVRLVIDVVDHEYGFALPAFRIDQRLEEDKVYVLEFVVDQAGVYPFFSHIYAGPGSNNMNGKLIVE